MARSPGPLQAQVHLPSRVISPGRQLGARLWVALVLLVLIAVVVYVDRNGYVDSTAHDGISFIDAVYYATVTMTTTGYGDITPVAEHSRLINIVVITPIRIAFLILVVSTAVEVLANEGRRALMDSQWRKTLRNHTVVIGYGTMGQSAAATLLRNGLPAEKIVVIDAKPLAVAEANRHNLAALEGEATSRDLLRRAELPKAREVIVTVNRDDTAILTTLTVRQLNRTAHLVVAVREAENRPLVRQSGADAVITSSDTVGRLMGLSSISPYLGEVIDDLLMADEGLEVHQRMITREEEGLNPADLPNERVLGIVRNKTLRRFFDASAEKLQLGDEIIAVRRSATAKDRRDADTDV